MRPVNQSNQITCLNVRYYCHSLYQAKGDYAHLHQKSDKDIEDTVGAATAKLFYDDPLNLDIQYAFLLERLSDPPDDALKSMLSITLILFVYFYPVARGLILHWYRSITASILSKDNINVFVQHGIRRRAKFRPIPTLYYRAFATADYHSKYSFSWDTDGITLVIDNSETAIISSHRRLFTGLLTPMSVTL